MSISKRAYLAGASRLVAIPVVVVGILGGGTTAALAQQASPAAKQAAASQTSLEEVVVTARRKEEQLQQVPVAITAFSGQTLVARGVRTPADLTASTPGVFTAPGSNRGSNTPVFAIRGQVNRDPTLTNDPSIGIYFAEVPWARPEGANAAFLDLQSVQVLKGPQGTLFGRNSTAGAILITPNAPTDTFEGYGKIGGGDYGYFTAEGVVNMPINDKVALRLAGSHEQRNGYLLNVTGGQKMDDVNNYSFRASLKADLSENITTTTIGSWYKSDTNGDGQRLIGVAPAPPSAGVAALYPRFVAALAQTNALGRYQYLSSFAPSVAAVSILGAPQSYQTQQYANVKTWSLQNTTRLDLGHSSFFGDLAVKSILSYRHETDGNSFETVAVPFLSVQSNGIQAVNQVTEELQLQGKQGPLDYIVGAFYFRESGHDTSYSQAVVPIFSIVDNKVTNTAYSVFAHANYDLSSLLNGLGVSAGVRLNHDERYLDNRNRRQTTPGTSASPLYTCYLNAVPANNGSACHFPEKITFNEPTWDASVNYKLTEDSMVYASVGHGYRAGGFSEGAQTLAATAAFQPEKTYSYEIGSKNDFRFGDTAARLNLAGFYTDYRNIQRTLNFVTTTGGLTNLTVNAAKAHIWGGEAEFTVKPTSALEVNLSYTYLKPKYDKFIDTYAETNRAFFPAGTPASVSQVFFPVDVSDSQFILVSRHSVSASVKYTLPVAESFGEPSLLATYYYRTGFYTTSDINTAHCTVPGDANPAAVYANCYNRGGKLPGYGLLNLRLDWANFFNKGIDVAVFVNNVTNKYYYTNALNALGSLGATSAQIGPPRMVGATITVPFGR